ncbi:MAG: SurA N-terminal domain-containing protein [Roseateles asaccharophilus]|uniref:Periplasmic chaperone PpiD n=1 Tax=Roseateles asaccharophilus TaxID=582607 RepID=A0A4R6NAE9_9BURK|nr:SurA N-terminal domain-containing protein [Roseateles asaccharophilus]MDN3543493.1 SurA N-terminal domain-containing protein [Roseateles asaccharophilus]TDP12129.1 peptidyl-prolyl cis-trans isomerase D [Roseateles asaccharophilus]
MFDFVRKHNRLFQLMLLILILPAFVLVGVEGYSRFMDGSNAGVATVDDRKITQAEWDAAHRNQVERLRSQMPNLDMKLVDSPEVRRESLDELVRERVLLAAAKGQHLTISDERLQQLFRSDPQFAFLRNPDGTVNKNLLLAQGMSSEMFAQRLRQDLTLRQVMLGVAGTGVASKANSALAFDALLQQREVQLQRFSAQDFLAQMNPSDAEVEAFYKEPANSARFQLPEMAQIEYLVLDLEALKSGVTVSDEDLKKYYEENQSRYTVAEERRASHILIKADKDTPAADRAKAKARAEELLTQARKNPAGFAELARKNSQDEGSAERGGDLDFFPRGAMVKPFEDAAYALKQGEISNVVETDFGYHLIQLTGVRGGDKKSFESVRADLEQEVRRQLAQKRYAELAEQFSNAVYEQSDSLKPAADKFKLNLQTAMVQRKPAPGASGVLASAKLLEAVFGNDALRNKRNTEAVEVGPSQLAAARVLDYKPARLPELADVKAQVRAQLMQKLAGEAAAKRGKERLEALQKGADATGLEPAQLISRAKPANLPPKVLNELLRADASTLPTYVGVDSGEGVYVLARINKLLPRDPALIDEQRASQQYAQAWTAAESQAYYNALKTHYKVKLSVPAAAASSAAP